MKLQTNFPLSTITTFKLGGPAKFYFKTTSAEEAVAAVLSAKEKKLKYHLLAGGSNTVFSDRGFNGLVIHFIKNKINARDLEIKNNRVIVLASLAWADFVKVMAGRGLAGSEKMAAIPGAIGGAVVSNAGAYGQEISQVVEWVEVFDGERIKRLSKKDCHFNYRDSIFKQQNLVVLRVGFKFKQGEASGLLKTVKEISRLRFKKFGYQPICAGSFFKNVYYDNDSPSPKASAKQRRISTASLIEQARITNLKCGGISIAPWHHNFLINDGTGTTKDLLTLAKKIKKVVHQKLGIELEEEVRLVI